MTQPLKGLRVLELARVLAGPWAGQTLADLGADVIKVESPEGDETRGWGPPFHKDGSASYFHSTNRGKKSLIANLKDVEDLKLIKSLASKADVLIENFKVDTLSKFSLDYNSVRECNPKIVYCSITGFGQTGPYAKRPGYDFIIQAMGGIMDLTGEEKDSPQKPGIAYADIFTGLYSVISILAGLQAVEKTGEGTHIDMALFDTQLGVLANQAATYLTTGEIPQRMGNSHPVIVPYQVFEVKGGSIVIACGNDNQFEKMCVALNLSFHLNEQYKTNQSRVENRQKLVPKIKQCLQQYKKEDILQRLEEAGVPAGPINNVKQALEDKQSIFRKMKMKAETGYYLNSPLKFNNLSLADNAYSPQLGADTEEIKKDIENGSLWSD